MVMKRFSQKYGKYYDATFALVAKQSTFRTLSTTVTQQNMFMKHYDIRTAFLNRDIEQELYLTQPEGYV